MCYSTGVTNELVRTLGLSDKTPPGLPGLKPSSNSVLTVAWIIRHATDFRLFFIAIENKFKLSANYMNNFVFLLHNVHHNHYSK